MVGSVALTVAVTLVLTAVVVFIWILLKKKLYASSVDQVLNSSVEWRAWLSMIRELDENKRLDIAMTQIRVLKYSYAAGLSPQVAADTMLVAMSEIEEKLDSETD